ncbi:MAG: RNA polymerase sigma factor [Lentimicrobiaceae bacterium]|jgi:RNA polymerase sigma-70 factor (ECF subfamily)|nr:RNA polymerase sigma factor [Lentimicrobiaceae bacterium]
MTTTIDLDDLIRDCKKGSHKAQSTVYQKYYKTMYNTAFRILKNADDACDVMQDAFLMAFRNLNQNIEKQTFEPWLRRIVINKSIDFLRKNKQDAFMYEFPEIEEESDEEEILLTNMKAEFVKKQIEKLHPRYNLILILHLIEGLDYEEIALYFGITNNAVRVRYMRAKHKLIEQLKKEWKF